MEYGRRSVSVGQPRDLSFFQSHYPYPGPLEEMWGVREGTRHPSTSGPSPVHSDDPG